jgi:hypothetical protein
MCYGQLAEWTRDLEKVSPGLKLAQDIFKNDSDNVEGIGRALGWRELENQAKWNQQNPEEGMAHAASATAAGMLGGWLGGGAGAGSGYVDQIGNAYEGGMAGASTGAGLMSGASGGANAQQALKMMQMMNSMQGQQQQPQQIPMPRPQGQMPELDTGPKGYEPMPKGPHYMTEEEKKRYRMMRGY